jgi:hypothetical protein
MCYCVSSYTFLSRIRLRFALMRGMGRPPEDLENAVLFSLLCNNNIKACTSTFN